MASSDEILENARQVTREQLLSAEAMGYLDALPPLTRVMKALGIWVRRSANRNTPSATGIVADVTDEEWRRLGGKPGHD